MLARDAGELDLAAELFARATPGDDARAELHVLRAFVRNGSLHRRVLRGILAVLLPGPGPTEYRFRILPNLTREYPSGTNDSTDYVPILYDWMMQFRR